MPEDLLPEATRRLAIVSGCVADCLPSGQLLFDSDSPMKTMVMHAKDVPESGGTRTCPVSRDYRRMIWMRSCWLACNSP
jgi:hypothetical protein